MRNEKINNRPLEEQINDRRKLEKAHVVFLKLYPKHKNTKSWDSIKSVSYPSLAETNPGGNINDPE